MPASPTPAQSEASRLNGAASRGPATPEGKARASRNAARHGLRSGEFALLPHEDTAAFEALRADLAARHAPVGEAERECVDELAHAAWRRRRLRALEDRALAAACGGTDDPDGPGGPPSLATLARYGARIERDHKAALAELDRLRSLRPALPRQHAHLGADAARLRWIADRLDEQAATNAGLTNEPDPTAAAVALAVDGEPPAAPPGPDHRLNRAQRRRLAALERAGGGGGRP